jgi:dipeptidyl aminopeptidase/acylaminoacyl peptidase
MYFSIEKRLLTFSFLLFQVGCQHMVSVPTDLSDRTRNVRLYSVEQFIDTNELSGSSFSPDGRKILVSSNAKGIDNAYALNIEDGNKEQLTDYPNRSIRVIDYFPHDERFLYLADRDGNEEDHLNVGELDGSHTDLTPGIRHLTKFMGWSSDGKSLFLSTNERDSRYFDIYEVLTDGYERKMVYKDETGYEVTAISRDKKFVILTKTNKRDDTDIHIYDRISGEMRNITPHAGRSEFKFQALSPDSKKILYTSNHKNEFRYLVSMDLESGDERIILQPDWDVIFSQYSYRGKYIAVCVNVNAKTQLILLNGKTYEKIKIPILKSGDITAISFSKDEGRMAFYLSTSRTPPNLYVFDLVTRDLEKISDTLNISIEANDLVEGELVSFVSYDGMEIPGILYKPHNATSNNKVPVLVWVHGGPGGQSRIKYHALTQYLVNQGYAIFAINNRGSSGYGKRFFTADDRKHGRADLDDCVASKKMLSDLDYVDSARIGIMGQSYGGYLSLAAVTFRPDEFAVAIDIFGITNWVRTLSNLPPWWEHLKEALYAEIGHPVNDREYLESISPLYHADRISKPIMVLQGANDPRVLQVESDEIVTAVKRNGIPINYLLFQDEGHELRKKGNRKTAYLEIKRFLDLYLKGKWLNSDEVH